MRWFGPQETFRVFRHTLTEALERISDARQAMAARLNEGMDDATNISSVLVQSNLADFDKQCGRLESLSVKFEQKIEQISRSHDGVRILLLMPENFFGFEANLVNRKLQSPAFRTARQLSGKGTIFKY